MKKRKENCWLMQSRIVASCRDNEAPTPHTTKRADARNFGLLQVGRAGGMRIAEFDFTFWNGNAGNRICGCRPVGRTGRS